MKFITLLLVLSACQTGTLGPVESPEQIRIDKLVAATVKIDVECGEDGGSGTGVVISTALAGYSKILTAAHLGSDDPTVECTYEITNSEGKKFQTSVVKKDKVSDLMLLEAVGTVSSFTPVAAYSFVGQNITCVGFPVEMLDDKTHLSVSKGTIKTRFDVEDRVTAGIYFGSSGGACFSDRNQVVGIVSYMLIGINVGGYGVPLPDHYYVTNAASINKFLNTPAV